MKAREGEEALRAKKQEEERLSQEQERQRLLEIERQRLEEEARIQAEKAEERRLIEMSLEGKLTKVHQKAMDKKETEKKFIEDKLRQGELARDILENEKKQIQTDAERLMK